MLMIAAIRAAQGDISMLREALREIVLGASGEE